MLEFVLQNVIKSEWSLTAFKLRLDFLQLKQVSSTSVISSFTLLFGNKDA